MSLSKKRDLLDQIYQELPSLPKVLSKLVVKLFFLENTDVISAIIGIAGNKPFKLRLWRISQKGDAFNIDFFVHPR